jgi:Na+-translocating ferredoxin:NAD+ oxidoreductase RnfA subunit
VPDLRWDTIIARTFILALVSGVALTGTYLALNPPNIADAALPATPRARHAWEWAMPVGVVVALFAGFLIAQATAMFGGVEHLRATTGLTYAEYVHQGFGQLTVATFLTVVVVALAMRVAPLASSRDRLLLRVLLGALCLLTLAVVASALYRMSLYQEAYGYTVLRVFVDGFELWLGLVIVMLLIAGIRLRGAWVPRAVLGSAAAFVLVFVGLNPDAFVASHNIDRFEAGRELDTAYLARLERRRHPGHRRAAAQRRGPLHPVQPLPPSVGPGSASTTTCSPGTSVGHEPRMPWPPWVRRRRFSTPRHPGIVASSARRSFPDPRHTRRHGSPHRARAQRPEPQPAR